MRFDDDIEWLKELKAGDRCAIPDRSYGSGGYVLLKVDRVTPTLFVLKSGGAEYRARRSNGCLTGAREHRSLLKVTPAILESLEAAALRRWLSSLTISMERGRDGAPTTSQLRAMREAFDKAAGAAADLGAALATLKG